METKNILMVGVGGQGTILASKLMTLALLDEGYDVKMSEIHGMSQRGGSVSSQIRYGKEVHSPVVELGGADIIVSFELVEALRNLEYLKSDGLMIVNDYKILPLSVISGNAEYPQDTLGLLSSKVNTLSLDAFSIAVELGNPKVMNIVLLGAVARKLGIDDIDWNKIIEQNVKPKFIDINKEAFRIGYESIK